MAKFDINIKNVTSYVNKLNNDINDYIKRHGKAPKPVLAIRVVDKKDTICNEN